MAARSQSSLTDSMINFGVDMETELIILSDSMIYFEVNYMSAGLTVERNMRVVRVNMTAGLTFEANKRVIVIRPGSWRVAGLSTPVSNR